MHMSRSWPSVVPAASCFCPSKIIPETKFVSGLHCALSAARADTGDKLTYTIEKAIARTAGRDHFNQLIRWHYLVRSARAWDWIFVPVKTIAPCLAHRCTLGWYLVVCLGGRRGCPATVNRRPTCQAGITMMDPRRPEEKVP